MENDTCHPMTAMRQRRPIGALGQEQPVGKKIVIVCFPLLSGLNLLSLGTVDQGRAKHQVLAAIKWLDYSSVSCVTIANTSPFPWLPETRTIQSREGTCVDRISCWPV